MKKVLIFLGVSLILSTSQVHAASIAVELIEARTEGGQATYMTASPGGPSSISGTVTGTYDDVTGIVTMDSGTTLFIWEEGPPCPPIWDPCVAWTDSHTNWSTGGASYSASAYSCIEGTWGPFMAISLCGGYTFGINNTDETILDYGTLPGTRTLGGDDEIAAFPHQQGSDWTTLTASFEPGYLIMQTADWDDIQFGHQLTFTHEANPTSTSTTTTTTNGDNEALGGYVVPITQQLWK